VRYSIGFAFVVALGVMGSAMGCGEDDNDCGARCLGDLGNVQVRFQPRVPFLTYDVDLVLDGASGAFTCEWSDGSGWTGLTNQTGSAQTVVNCGSRGFSIKATLESVEISVTVQDGSWTGSAKESPDYVRVTRCPGGSELCPPFAVVTIEQQ
jgi:hypothetical protein